MTRSEKLNDLFRRQTQKGCWIGFLDAGKHEKGKRIYILDPTSTFSVPMEPYCFYWAIYLTATGPAYYTMLLPHGGSISGQILNIEGGIGFSGEQ